MVKYRIPLNTTIDYGSGNFLLNTLPNQAPYNHIYKVKSSAHSLELDPEIQFNQDRKNDNN